MQRELPPGHPVDTFLRENDALRNRIRRIREAITRLREASADVPLAEVLAALQEAYDDLTSIELHFLRKEGLLFPHLERYGISGPSTVMWGIDDQIRGRLADIGK